MDIIDFVVEEKNLNSLKTKIAEKPSKKVPKKLKKAVNERKWILFKYEFAHNTKLGSFLYKIHEKLKCRNQ